MFSTISQESIGAKFSSSSTTGSITTNNESDICYMSIPTKIHTQNKLCIANQMGYPHQSFPQNVMVQNVVLPFNQNMSQLSLASTSNNAFISTSKDNQETSSPKFNHSSIEYKYN